MRPVRRSGAAIAITLATASTGGLLTAAAAPASAATTCASPVYKRQFFANTTFSGTPKKTDCDTAIDQNWGTAAPASGLPANNFGVRWTVTRDFGSGGPFSLPVSTQDGIRVYLDGTRKVDIWKNVSSTVKRTVNITIPAGKHTLRVDYVNWTGTANVKFAYTPRTTATVDKVKPLTPTGTAVTYDTATGKAKLTWSKNKEMDLAGYRVYRRLKGSTTWTKLTTTTSTSYTNTPPTTGDTYYFEVRAIDKAGNESGGTADKAVTTVDKTAPERVTGVSALGTTAGNAITWQASSKDVDHYEVWAAPVGQQDLDGPAFVFETSYTDPIADAGTAYRYTLQAVDGSGNISPVSEPVTVTRPVASTAPVPSAVKGTPADAFTNVTWTAAEDPDAVVTGFHVYRRTSPNGAWALVAGAGASATSYEDRSAPKGNAYYYVVGVDSHGADSEPSEAAVVDRLTPATATGPLAPQLTLVSSGSTRSPIQVGIKPGAGDEGRLLSHYSWNISGACGDSGLGGRTTTSTIAWTPPYSGPCMVSVFAVDAYGRTGEKGSWLEFTVGR
ncbi:fibronectin type III domain-containing protein [Streptomyces sp. NBC_00620]|uniref:fibronectin type III domain-containing protein n=1 Tax=Streptomyces sp. NBC_00620 TaxID=2903666 RepID=UPI002255041C|nr:PA14 domain-containing protein [Streptomyces sp. NBC_00620]MCX4972742.1 PA14 domain-containing protein [Streptomyces sp. NBC_00620]